MFYNTRMRKMEAAALIANFAIDELVMRTTRAGDIRDYYDIAVFRYLDDGIEPIIASEEEGGPGSSVSEKKCFFSRIRTTDLISAS